MAACNKQQDAVNAVAVQAPSSPASAVDNREVAAVPSCLPKESPKAVGAPDDSRESLMREVFPGWTKEHACVFVERDDESQPIGEAAVVHPEVAMSFCADRRVLVVSGEPSDLRGMTAGAHAQPGNLASYGFTLRDGRWFVSHATPSIATVGYFGKVGVVELVELGPGHPGLTVTSGSCWQGPCGSWMRCYEVNADGELLHSGDFGMVFSTSTAANTANTTCEAWLMSAMAWTPPPAPPNIGEDCFYIVGTARTVPVPGQAWSDFVIGFVGGETVIDATTRQASPRAVRETAVWRRKGDAYELVQGRNPTHGL